MERTLIMENFFASVWEMIVESNVLHIVAAVLILVIGWLLAVWLSGAVRRGLEAMTIGQKLGQCLPAGAEVPTANIAKYVGRAVYFLILLFAILGCLTALDLSQAAAPIQKFFDTLSEYAANLIGALALAFIAWLVATLVKMAAGAAIRSMNLEKKLAEHADVKDGESIAATTAGVLYWVVLLFFLPSILRTLKITGITGPIEQMLTKFMEYIPNLVAAGAILFVGLFAAKIIRKAASGLVVISHLDDLGEKVGVSKVFGNQGLSGMIGIVAYTLVAIPVVISALTALKIDSLSNSVAGLFDKFLNATGDIIGAALLIFIAFLVGSFVAGIVTQIFETFGFNPLMAKLGFKNKETSSAPTPAALVGKVAFVTIIFMAAIAAADLLQFQQLSALLRSFMNFGGNIIVGIIVMLIGIWLSNFAADAVRDKCNSLVALVVRLAVLIFTGAIAIHSMDVGGPIVHTAFTFLLGAVCVAIALAFGLGGRDFAAAKLQEWKEQFDKKA
ncbi:MAG: mechanosensitive ion channel [Lentisphaeria bacterium]|nr:mechanosensitive ion channel [Lentisphaeria bacterium]